MSTSSEKPGNRRRRVYPFFSTPLRRFAGVLSPIAALMGLLAWHSAVPTWMRLTAGGVVLVSLVALYRGYGHRIEVSRQGVRYRGLWRNVRIDWIDVRLMDRYVPLDRNPHARYVYISRLSSPPVDWREIDDNTIQLQDRPGLLVALESMRKASPENDTGNEPPSFPAGPANTERDEAVGASGL
jgi:hypothetical protein